MQILFFITLNMQIQKGITNKRFWKINKNLFHTSHNLSSWRREPTELCYCSAAIFIESTPPWCWKFKSEMSSIMIWLDFKFFWCVCFKWVLKSCAEASWMQTNSIWKYCFSHPGWSVPYEYGNTAVVELSWLSPSWREVVCGTIFCWFSLTAIHHFPIVSSVKIW